MAGEFNGDERVLPLIVERKTYSDFQKSMTDGRYISQSATMLHCATAFGSGA